MPALPGETTRERTFAAFCRAHLEPLRGLPGARYGGGESPGRPSREHVGPGKADTAPKAPRAPESAHAARSPSGDLRRGPRCLPGVTPDSRALRSAPEDTDPRLPATIQGGPPVAWAAASPAVSAGPR